ncbi:hypothetical protein BX666DRAFT_1954905 [Dichotomocladium elegans]|nr:hypothetical protein BX666DRAFT_1954905 [Dichotomocladium elegans]
MLDKCLAYRIFRWLPVKGRKEVGGKKIVIEAILFQEVKGKNSGKNYFYVYSMKKDV